MITSLVPKSVWDALRAESAQSLALVDPFSPDQPVVFATGYFYEYTGYEPSEVIGCNCRFLQGPGTDAVTKLALQAAIATQSPIVTTILNYRRDGRPFWNKLDIRPVHDTHGRLALFLGFQNPADTAAKTIFNPRPA